MTMKPECKSSHHYQYLHYNLTMLSLATMSQVSIQGTSIISYEHYGFNGCHSYIHINTYLDIYISIELYGNI